MKPAALSHASPDTLEKRGKTAACVGCPTGFELAGMDRQEPSRFAQTVACARCGRGVTRLVTSSASCISCMNREYESLKGRNSKGTRSIQAQPLHRLSVRYTVGNGEPQLLRVERAADFTEVMLRVLRQTPGQIRFLPPVQAGNSDQEQAA
jgi:hypothetical protein